MDSRRIPLQLGDNSNISIDLDEVIAKYTNKNRQIEAHEGALRRQENFLLPADNVNFLTKLKSLSAVQLHKKNRLDLKDLLKSIDKPVTGKFLLCRSLCPPMKLTALFTVVDDPDGKLGVQIGLYNFDEIIELNFLRDSSHSRPADVYQYLPVGTVLAIMNPWFTKTDDGGLYIRCDKPAEVVILNQSMVKEIFECIKWNGDIPITYRQPGDSVTHTNWREIGNQRYVQKRYRDAIDAYTNGINDEECSDQNRIHLLANRSAAYLAMRRYSLSLADADAVLDVKSDHVKCISRKSNALFGLAQYENALEFLQCDVSFEMIPSRYLKVVNDLIVRAKALVVQSQTGEYPWTDIFYNKFSNDELADFTGPVIVKMTSTKGRGLFATDAIRSGQLILASRAFARVVQDNTEESNRTSTSVDIGMRLVNEVTNILRESPEKCQDLYNLYAGPNLGSQNAPITSQSCIEIDKRRIAHICYYNRFGRDFCSKSPEEEGTCGIWLLPSYINHSCVDANTTWHERGDFLFFFAFHDIAKNEEILISYGPPLGQTTRELQEKFHFTCNCRFCIRDRQDDTVVRSKRSNLMSRLDAILQKYASHTNGKLIVAEKHENKIKGILKSLEDLLTDAPELNISYVDHIRLLGHIFFISERYWDAINILEKVYNLVANIPVFCIMVISISSSIVLCYAKLHRTDKATQWIAVLKRYTTLAYGTWKVIDGTFPIVYDTLTKQRVS